MQKIPFRAALFDLDGTLLDSMGVWTRVDEVFFDGRSRLALDIMAAAADVGFFFPLAMLEVLLDRGVLLAKQQIDEEADGGAQNDLEAKKDEGQIPIRPEIAKKDGQGLVAAGEEYRDEGAGR